MKVVFVESHDLDYRDPLGSHQYIRLFRDEGHRCLWLGPAVSPLHLLKPDYNNRHRFRVWKECGRRLQEIDWLVPLTLLPYYKLPLLQSGYAGRNQYQFCLPPLRRSLLKHGYDKTDLLWCANPTALSLLEMIPHRFSCYRLADRVDQFSRVPQSILGLQRELIQKVDAVLTTSRDLHRWASEIRPEGVHYVPNGVNDFFFQDNGPLPADFPADGHPVVVFVGAIDSWFDTETLEYAVETLSDLHFLLIGPLKDKHIGEKLEFLKNKVNFTYLGGRDHTTIPAYLKACAAAIIPFKLTELTHAVNPIKYYEYLACGLPVVASPMRELLELRGPLFTYRDRGQFCASLREAVGSKAEMEQSLTAFARENTWKSRYELIKQIFDGWQSDETS